MCKTRTVVLRSEGLLNKWGFSDGDLVADDTGSRHDLLVELVKEHLLPLLPGVDVDRIADTLNEGEPDGSTFYKARKHGTPMCRGMEELV